MRSRSPGGNAKGLADHQPACSLNAQVKKITAVFPLNGYDAEATLSRDGDAQRASSKRRPVSELQPTSGRTGCLIDPEPAGCTTSSSAWSPHVTARRSILIGTRNGHVPSALQRSRTCARWARTAMGVISASDLKRRTTLVVDVAHTWKKDKHILCHLVKTSYGMGKRTQEDRI